MVNIVYDYILDDMRISDVGLVSATSLAIPDPLIVNNLQVRTNASINNLYANNIRASLASVGNIISNNIAVVSNASFNNINTLTLSASTASINYGIFNQINVASLVSAHFIRTTDLVVASNASFWDVSLNVMNWNTLASLSPIEGQMLWDSNSGALSYGLAGGNVVNEIGLQTMLPKRVRNSTGSTIPKGTAVYLNGVSGNTPLISRAIATGDATSAFTIGMTAEDINNNNTGWVITQGLIQGLNLSSFNSGDTLYLSGATAGYYTNVPTRAPVHYVRLGTVTKATSSGELIVTVINGYELDELHNVVISSLASGQIIMSGASSLWYNITPAFVPSASYPSLGSLAIMNQLSYTSLLNLPSLGSLAFQNNISLGSLAVMNALSYGSILNLPSLGSLAQMNALSFTSLLNQPSLSSLAFQSTVDYPTQVLNKPSLGSLANINQLSFTSLTNQPSLSSLAFQSTIDYTSSQLINKPSLGSLAPMNQLSFTSLTNQPSLSSLAFQSTVPYTQVTGVPSLGSLAIMNQLSFTSLLNQPSLGSLAFQNVVSLGSLAVMNQLSFTSLTNQPSLGSLAPLNAVTQAYLPSNVSFNIIYTNGIANNSTISTNLLYSNNIFASTISVGNITGLNGAFTSTVSTNLLYANGVFVSNISTGIITSLGGNFLSTVSTNRLNTNQVFASTISAGQITSNNIAVTSTASIQAIRGVDSFFTGNVSVNNIYANNLTVSTASINTLFAANISVNYINGYIYSGQNTGDQSDTWYGDGSDSYLIFDNSNTYSLATLVPATSTYTLLRDIYPSLMYITGGVTVKTNGYRIFTRYLEIQGSGILQNNGNNASGASAGIGGAGNYFAAGSNGAAGLLAASAGAVGTAPTVPTANTLVGGIGGRGAAARNAITTFTGNNVTTSSITVPTPQNGGTRLVSAITGWNQRFLTSGTGTNFQFTPSMGGGAGAKSTTGTTATSGGGGGGGGVLFLAAETIYAPNGSIQAKGGNGGNAAGSAGNFGGGGGGGGGVIGVITSGASYNPDWFNVSGGDGGSSIGSLVSAALPVAYSGGFGTATSSGASIVVITPINLPSLNSIYIVAAHIQGPVNNVPRIISVTGGGNLNWYQVNNVQFGTIAAPTRRLDVWYGYKLSIDATNSQSNILEDYNFNVTFDSLPSSVRINIDEIQNTNASFGYDPGWASATNSFDSTATSTVVLANPPSTFDLVWTGVARTAGTVPVAGTGNTLLNSQNTAPILVSEVSSFQQTNNMSWTTATQAGVVSFQIIQPSNIEPGTEGWKGKVVAFYA
jgi:hypothetical protein